MKKIYLAEDTIDKEDIQALSDWLLTYPRLTKGELTERFEYNWSQKLGVKHSIFVNSGSSANLLMLYSLIEKGAVNLGDRIVIPALSWATDLSPVIHLGLEPVLCDVNNYDLSIDLSMFQILIEKYDPKVLLLVSVLGLVPEMKKIKQICKDNNIILLEDTCESLGSKYNGKMLGTYGLMSSFSLYYGHHLSTIEGGMICTNDTSIYYLIKSLRSHGWSRESPKSTQKMLQDKYNISDFDSKYTFYIPGFNVRATDLQAFLGLRQLDKWNSVCETRNKNFQYYNKKFSNKIWQPLVRTRDFVSNFAYPIIIYERNNLVKELKENNIECRPLISGNIGLQPMYIDRYPKCSLKKADIVHRFGMYVPNHDSLSKSDLDLISSIVNKYTSSGKLF